ncbi:MAG: multicopper oxidase domain-containing protein, partial [Steroidobacteraceae bacterium]
MKTSRRRFVLGIAGSAVGAAAEASRLAWAGGVSSTAELRGTVFQLEIGAREVDFTGRARPATVVNGRLPAPTLRWRQGDTITVRVANRLPVPSSIHWHGVLVPSDMDGVPGLSFNGIGPGET